MQPHLVTRLKAKADKAHEVYRTSSNESTKANRRAKLAFYNTVNQTMHNSQISAKKKFSILSRLLKTQKVSSVPPIIENGEVVTDAQAKCNLFNNFFSSKATVPGNDDPVPYLEPRTDIKEPLSNFNTSPFKLADILRNIKKSNFSHCGIPGHFLALVATPVSFQLYKVFNNMWEAGIFADIFKVGHVCCIYKRSGLKSDKSSWRPVTLLPSLSKCAEAVMHRRLLSHFIENNIISERQAAYLKGDSTIQQVLYMIHLIRTTWSKKQIMQGVYLDMSAAFDKAWHKAIIAKLEQIQVKGACLDVFRSYLSNRKQIVVIGQCKDVQAGIPQRLWL